MTQDVEWCFLRKEKYLEREKDLGREMYGYSIICVVDDLEGWAIA